VQQQHVCNYDRARGHCQCKLRQGLEWHPRPKDVCFVYLHLLRRLRWLVLGPCHPQQQQPTLAPRASCSSINTLC
jgi:hypothetical protein